MQLRIAFAGAFAARLEAPVRARLDLSCDVVVDDEQGIVSRLADVEVLVTMAFTAEMAAAALRALELNPKLATSSALLGFLRATYDWDWQAGVVELERAVAAAPQETGTVWSYAYVLSRLGRHEEAVALVRGLAAARPADGRMKQEVAEQLIDAGKSVDGLAWASAR